MAIYVPSNSPFKAPNQVAYEILHKHVYTAKAIRRHYSRLGDMSTFRNGLARTAILVRDELRDQCPEECYKDPSIRTFEPVFSTFSIISTPPFQGSLVPEFDPASLVHSAVKMKMPKMPFGPQ